MRTRIARFGLLATATLAALLGTSPIALAAPALQLSQNSGLTVGQTVTVTLDGLPPNLPTVAVGQCKPQVVAPTDCNLTGSLLGTADPQGTWQPNGGNKTLTLIATVGGTDCTAAAGACTIAVTSLTNPNQILASVPLTFGPAAASAKPSATEGDSSASESSDEDSNTPLIIGIAAVVVVVVGAGITVAARRRAGGSR